MAKTLEKFKEELDDVLLCIRDTFVKLGEKLFEGHEQLKATEYDKLVEYVEKQGIRKSDQRAAVAAFLHGREDLGDEDHERIDPRLVFAGAANSKILSLDKQDQKRLLGNEKFDVLQPSGRAAKKTWAKMSEQERATLIAKGGRIRVGDRSACPGDRHMTLGRNGMTRSSSGRTAARRSVSSSRCGCRFPSKCRGNGGISWDPG